MSRIFTAVATLAATTLISSAAFAGCNSGTYCSGGSTLAPLSSWSGTSTMGSSYTVPSYTSSSYSSGSSYGSSMTYGASYTGNSYGGVMSDAEANSTYGTGSISSAYAGGDVELYGFSGSTSSVAGLGYGESLQSTNCPVNVYNPSGARVLGCYNVVKQVPQTNYVRVVRPVVYVRYPVPTPVAVPYYVNNYGGCGSNSHFSRYGSFGLAGYGPRCG